ncbi:MAG: TraB/GumN family protein [Ignavibacteriales bacterium]|jgi:Uncharacterized protein conserved in bacteria|nr:MAG: TraB/GumN family protein [Ignavibacteriaceae bacterium]MBW7873387.1 TraB/GumN family protein [Ignavibacteria bacterium]MCZ2142077.1 TraB/GumN family protein [Ignavibacteriales bacterium]OQY71653.1 MAG: hypothetical protein B6D45_09835 [Ignavibacteriales bacterium UTCHB3]MBV6444815.1 hypothetical protein [Ignavibacteriaceae bacterium]
MKTFRLFTLLLLLLCLPCSAQGQAGQITAQLHGEKAQGSYYLDTLQNIAQLPGGSTHASKEEIAAQQPGDSAKVSDYLFTVKKGAATFQIMGSIHVAKGMELSDTVKSLIEWADEIFFEVDMKDMTDPQLTFRILPLMRLPDGKSLKDIYEPDKVKILKERFKKAGLAWSVMKHYKPIFGAFSAASVAAMKQEVAAEPGTEYKVYDYAQKFNKPTGGFETVEFQISLFDSLDYDTQFEMALSIFDRIDSLASDLDDILSAFQSGNISEFGKVLDDDPMTQNNQFNRIFLLDRNKKWAQKIEELAASAPKKYLIVVGTAHLIGTGSLIELLSR